MRSTALFLALTTIGCSDPTVSKDYLAVISVSPDQGATQVAADTNIIAGFSEALVPSSVDQQNIYLTDSTGGPVIASVEYQSRAHWVIIDPEADLAPNSTYVVTFSSNIRGERSGYLLAPVQTQFTTAGINPTNELPIANAGADAEGSVGQTLTLDGSMSTDPEGASLSFTWRIVMAPAGSESTLSALDQPNPTLTPDTEGEYVVGLIVNDGVQDSSEDFTSLRILGSASVDTGATTDTGSSNAPDTGE